MNEKTGVLEGIHGDGIHEAIEAGIKLGELRSTPITIDIHGVRHVIVPQGDLRSMHDLQERPHALKRTVTFRTPESFSTYVNEFKDPCSRIYADERFSKMICVLDDHESGTDTGSPRWCRHIAMLELDKTPEWKRWSECDGKHMTQLEFAEFLEDGELEITEPKTVRLMEIIQHMQISSKANVASTVSTLAGGISYQYSSEKGVSGNTVIPPRFNIIAEIWKGSGLREMAVRLRYRVTKGDDGHLVFYYSIANKDRLMSDALAAMCDTIKGMTNIMPLYGTI